MTLEQLPTGRPATIKALHSHDGLRARMVALGLRTGREIAVIRRARFGGPLQVRIGNTDLVIRRNEASLIEVVENDCASCNLNCPNPRPGNT
jgi:ferrous iron transport protein A